MKKHILSGISPPTELKLLYSLLIVKGVVITMGVHLQSNCRVQLSRK